jgi:hypothetical protein
MRVPKLRNKAGRIALLLTPIIILLLCLFAVWVRDEFIFAAFTDFKRTLADTSIIDGAELKKQRLEMGIDPYEIVEMQLPKGASEKLLHKNILKYCVDKSQDCTQPIWRCISDYNSFGDSGQKINTNNSGKCTMFCTATWWKVRNGFRNYIDEVCIDIETDFLTYQYIEI